MVLDQTGSILVDLETCKHVIIKTYDLNIHVRIVSTTRLRSEIAVYIIRPFRGECATMTVAIGVARIVHGNSRQKIINSMKDGIVTER